MQLMFIAILFVLCSMFGQTEAGSLRRTNDLSFETFVEKHHGLVESHRILNHNNFSCIAPGSAIGEVTTTCSNNGVCQSDGHCYCNNKYATYPEDSDTECNYHRKSRFIAFAWHLFFGLESGAGEWYLGNNDYATFEVVLFIPALIGFTCLFGIFGCCIDMCNQKKDTLSSTNEKGEATQCCGLIGLVLGICSVFAMFGWWSFELWSIATYNRTDGNGVDTW